MTLRVSGALKSTTTIRWRHHWWGDTADWLGKITERWQYTFLLSDNATERMVKRNRLKATYPLRNIETVIFTSRCIFTISQLSEFKRTEIVIENKIIE
jgi:hypothetical protein